VSCSGHVSSCNRSVTLPTPSCGSTNVTYMYNYCNYEKLAFNFQNGTCNLTTAGFNGRSGPCSFAFLDGSFTLPMDFTSPMQPKTCRSLNYTTEIDTCSSTPSQIQVQGRLTNQTYCRAYIFLRVNWNKADPPKVPSAKPTAKPNGKPTTQPNGSAISKGNPTSPPNLSPPGSKGSFSASTAKPYAKPASKGSAH